MMLRFARLGSIVLILTTGCVAPKRASLVIPQRCIHVNAESFTRPCARRNDGKLVCDGVVVSALCVQVRQ
jgi:hypothetical protein